MIIAAAMLAGCSSTRYGGRLVTVELDSDPSGAPAYLIPNHRYLDNPDIANSKKSLEPFYKGKTPVSVRIKPYLWDYVIIRPDGLISYPREFNPTELSDGTVQPDPRPVTP